MSLLLTEQNDVSQLMMSRWRNLLDVSWCRICCYFAQQRWFPHWTHSVSVLDYSHAANNKPNDTLCSNRHRTTISSAQKFQQLMFFEVKKVRKN